MLSVRDVNDQHPAVEVQKDPARELACMKFSSMNSAYEGGFAAGQVDRHARVAAGPSPMRSGSGHPDDPLYESGAEGVRGGMGWR